MHVRTEELECNDVWSSSVGLSVSWCFSQRDLQRSITRFNRPTEICFSPVLTLIKSIHLIPHHLLPSVNSARSVSLTHTYSRTHTHTHSHYTHTHSHTHSHTHTHTHTLYTHTHSHTRSALCFRRSCFRSDRVTPEQWTRACDRANQSGVSDECYHHHTFTSENQVYSLLFSVRMSWDLPQDVFPSRSWRIYAQKCLWFSKRRMERIFQRGDSSISSPLVMMKEALVLWSRESKRFSYLISCHDQTRPVFQLWEACFSSTDTLGIHGTVRAPLKTLSRSALASLHLYEWENRWRLWASSHFLSS